MDSHDLNDEKQNELSLNPSEDESTDHPSLTATKLAEKTVDAAAESILAVKATATGPTIKSKPKPKKPVLTRTDLERLYKLPETPHIVVHPSKTAKNGKFECKMVSLSHLLSYHKDDNKESSFEVSLFAENFNEMIMRDFSFQIFKHLISVKDDNTATISAGTKRKLSVSNESSSDTVDAESKKSRQSMVLK